MGFTEPYMGFGLYYRQCRSCGRIMEIVPRMGPAGRDEPEEDFVTGGWCSNFCIVESEAASMYSLGIAAETAALMLNLKSGSQAYAILQEFYAMRAR